MANIEWAEGYAHSYKKDKDTYFLEYGGINQDTFESFSGYVYIKRCKEACDNGKWVAVPQNPFNKNYDTAVILGGSPKVVIKRVLKKVSTWRKAWDNGKEQREHKVQEQSTGETDSLPF